MYWFCSGHNLWQEIPAQEQAAGVHNNLGIVIFLFRFVRLKDRSGLLGYMLFSLVVGMCGVKQKDDLEELRASCVRASQGRSDLLTFYHHSVNKRSDHIRFIIKRQQSREVYLMYHLSCEIESNLVCLKCASINKKNSYHQSSANSVS